ncbi:MAG: hypothetical protein RBR67_00615 [Desulfobacterium sp.]|jgi:hypothetical protein|nr:hypothetical protein [Desulfobacterium sp.]
MTTIPGHNIIIQQSGAVHEATQHVRSGKPDPEQLAAQQAARAEVEKTTVPESNDARGVAPERERGKKERKSSKGAGANRPPGKDVDKETKDEQDPAGTGNLLDTIA